MFFGFLSERLPDFNIKAETAVNRNGFQLYIDLSGSRAFLLDRPKTTLAFWGRIYGESNLSALFESLVESYEQDGDSKNIFSMLEGDFSLVLFDHHRQLIFLGTDRFVRGEIYWYARHPVAFFTRPSFFFQKTGFKPKLNIKPVWDRFAIGAITPPETVYKEVYSNVTGEYVCIDSNGGAQRIQYWSPLNVVKERMKERISDPQGCIKKLRRCFTEKVYQEILPYGKLGVGLSGGMDSAAILGAARKNFDGEIVAVTVGPDGPDSSTLPLARKSAEFNKAHHIEYYPRAVDLDDFPKVMGGFAQPFRSASSFMNHQIAKKISEAEGECVLWGFGADLILGNAGYCRRFYNKEGGIFPSEIINPVISALQYMPQNRVVIGAINRLMWYRGPVDERLGEKYFRVLKKPRFYQEKRLFKEEFLSLGREREILRRIEDLLDHGGDFIIERLIEVDFKIIHMYHQVSGAHQTCRLNGIDSIITYYNKDYAEINLMITNGIRSLNGWNKYVLREAFKPFLHEDVYRGKRSACVIRWDRIISGLFKDAVIRYLKSSQIIQQIFKTDYLHRLNRMIKHPGLMYLNLLGLALWYDVNFKGVCPDTPLSTILDYKWRNQDKRWM